MSAHQVTFSLKGIGPDVALVRAVHEQVNAATTAEDRQRAMADAIIRLAGRLLSLSATAALRTPTRT